MLTKEREEQIQKYLERHERVSTIELAEKFQTSKATIRRDLARLETQGKLLRIHGGAEKISPIDEPTYLEKTSKNTQEKQKIAQKAAQFVLDNEVIYLDAGTTTSFLVPLLKNKSIKVVTNSLHHATNLVNSGVETIVLGGQIKTTTDAIIGMQAVEQLKSYQINRAFIGVNGVHDHFGYSTPDNLEAMIKRAAIEQAEHAYILTDKTKLDKVTFCKIADLTAAKLITN
ncbi:MAG: DeoR/GlpR family DNA-binding transcription regulator [Streptococcaceae bacterium]|jgi:DeoR family fructose operon transcriptional repressor|nr:DeoR/GlpR family DNA-binding transcription regulator [Streptococcaceae bacterium]